MGLQHLADYRRRVAASRTAAITYFTVVLLGLAVARTWVSGDAVAYVGIAIYSLPAFVTWPLADAMASRYASQPIVSAPARERLHWVICVLLGILISIVIGGLTTS